MSYGLPVGAVVNCADNTGAKNLYLISVKRTSRGALENPGARDALDVASRGSMTTRDGAGCAREGVTWMMRVMWRDV